MSMPSYYRTFNDGRQRIHLEGISDMSLCGFDLSGDDTIHDKDPEKLTGFHRVTCEHCQQIMEIVARHKGWSTTSTTGTPDEGREG